MTHDVLAFVTAWLPAPPARVLDVGCGDGTLTRLLAQAGYEATGLDPEAPKGEEFVRGSLEDFRTVTLFDAAVAIRSLHHVHDLPRALDSLRAALRPGARLVLFELAAEHVDDDARRWAAEHGIDADWHLDDVIRLGELRAALGERFRLLHDEPAPYFAREAGREDLVPLEETAIGSGVLRPAGARLVYESWALRGEISLSSPMLQRAEAARALRWVAGAFVLALSVPASGPALSTVDSYAEPAWSPTGARIAFVKRTTPAEGQPELLAASILTMRTDGSGVRTLVAPPAVSRYNLGWPSWSPDGRRIVFSDGRLFVIRSDGRGLRRIAREGAHPSWSPGGRKIAFNTPTLDTDVGDLVVTDPNGGHLIVAADSGGRLAYGMPTWSPRGDRLAFVVAAAPDIADPFKSFVAAIDKYGGKIRRIASAPSDEPAWSPDGRRIAYTSNEVVRLLDLRTRRTTVLHSGSHPSWSPDGRRIVFADRGQIFVIDSNGTHLRQLTR